MVIAASGWGGGWRVWGVVLMVVVVGDPADGCMLSCRHTVVEQRG